MFNANPKTNDFLNTPAVQELLSSYASPDEANLRSWELLLAAMGSSHADVWSKEERAGMMFHVELLQNLVKEVYRIANQTSTRVNTREYSFV
ncbi:hypothetical protein [Chitinophaga alhagiae]|uniref:hypothetical protein n=1 Tax=Chitinophaga alhagiae TaxID=2203219 RepID=UPI000E5C0623|nr:hypothetical protein [Chitinophaga alhagiae]